jgi:hypothetical protein
VFEKIHGVTSTVLLFSPRCTLAGLHVVAFVCSMLKHVAILAVGITRALKHVFGHSGMKQSLTSLLRDQQQRWPILSPCTSWCSVGGYGC